MKEPIPTKKELAAHYRVLEEQINRLKSRLNGQVFKKTKHGHRLDQLSESARALNDRIGQIESRMQNLAAQNSVLQRETEALRGKRGGKKRLKAQLRQISSEVEGLYHQQQQLRQALQQSSQTATRIADLRDDLRRESDDLKAHVHDLEENSSRATISQAAQRERLEALENALADLARAQQEIDPGDQASLQRELDDAILPLQATVQRLEAQSDEDGTKLEEIDRQLDALQRAQSEVDGAIERLEREQQKRDEDLDGRLRALKQENSSLHQELTTLHLQYRDASSSEHDQRRATEQAIQTALQQQAPPGERGLDELTQRLDSIQQAVDGNDAGLGSHLTSLDAEIARLNEADEFLQERFRGLGSMELGLTSRMDALQQSLDRQSENTAALELRLNRLDESAERKANRLDAQFEALRSENAERLAEHAVVNDKLDALESTLTDQREQQLKQAEQADRQTSELSSLAEQLDAQQRADREHTESLQQLSERTDEQETTQQALDEKLQNIQTWTDEQSTLQKQITAAVDASKSSLDEVQALGLKANERIAGLEHAQQAMRDQQENTKPLLESHTQTLQKVEERLNDIDGSLSDQQLKIAKTVSTERANRVAIAALLMLGLLGGLALYFANLAKVAESEQRITQQLLTTDPRYATTEQLSDSMRVLESSQAANQNRIEALQATSPSTLATRQSELEQRLARLEVRLNLIAAGATPAEPANLDLHRMQGDIERLWERFAALDNPSPSKDPAASASLDALGSRIDALGAAVDRRISRLEDARQTVRAGSALDTPSGIDPEQLGRRVEMLESASEATQRMQQQLRNQLANVQRSLTTLDRRVATGTDNDPDMLWRTAGEHGRYTIQLAGARSLDSLQRFARRLPSADERAFYRTQHLGGDWNILLYGIYSSLREAKSALASLPSELTKYQPWIRRIPGDYTYIEQ